MKQPTTHVVKCWPEYFEALAANAKPFELRIGDRSYAVGDLFVAQEWCRQSQRYSGRQCVREITYVGRDLPGLLSEYVALGMRELVRPEPNIEAAADLLLEAIDTIQESRDTLFKSHQLDGRIPDADADAKAIVAYLDDWMRRADTWLDQAE